MNVLGVRLESVQSFLVLAEELHFARAAQRLGITAGGLSRRIAQLEQRLGARLLARTTGSVELTPAGERLRPALERLLRDFAGCFPDAEAGDWAIRPAG